MPKNTRCVLRRWSDHVSEELATALMADSWFEFKPLYSLVHAGLLERHTASRDTVMLRLRTYERLHELVKKGIVEKVGGKYRGIRAALTAYREHVAAEHCRELIDRVHHTEAPEQERA
jgi:hypothetical protein